VNESPLFGEAYKKGDFPYVQRLLRYAFVTSWDRFAFNSRTL